MPAGPAEPTVIGSYRILSRLGAGGMGEVYLAFDDKLQRQVAVKLLPAHVATDAEWLRRFHAEARTVSALNHPHVLVIFDFGEADGRPFMVTEYVEGRSLRQRLDGGPVPLHEAVDIGMQMASALGAAHARGIVHRDIKPDNVMLRPDGYIKVLDFGIAKIVDRPAIDGDTIVRTDPGIVMGTPRYMSPEQARGLPLDARADVWSVGVMLYEMVAGHPPFEGSTAADVLAAILRAEPRPIVTSRDPSAKTFDRIIARTLAKKATDRYASAVDLLADLAALKTEMDSGAQRVPVTELHTATAGQTIDSLAVLPFVNASGDPDAEYLSDGIAESLINSLSQLQELRVVPRSKAFRFKGKDIDPRKAGRQLRVQALLTGKVLHRGDLLQVQAELVDVATESQLWGERFNRKAADIFAVEAEIATQITDKLRVELRGRDPGRLLERYTESSEAYHLYLKGRYHWNKRTAHGLQKAIEYFQKAIDVDPTYALAYAGLSDGYTVLPFFAPIPAKAMFEKSKAAAAKALAIDPDLPEALTALGPIEACLDWQWAAAERTLKRAVQLKPDFWLAHDHLALVLSAVGKHDEALGEMARGQELEPLAPVVNHHYAWVAIRARQYDLAIEQARKSLDLDPHFHMGSLWLGIASSLKSRHADAIAAVESAVRGLGTTNASGELARTYAAAGEEAEARRLLADLHKTFDGGYAEPYSFALIYTALGDPDNAFRWLDIAAQNRSGHLALWANVDPRLDALRADPRMSEFLRRMGFGDGGPGRPAIT